MILNYKQDRSSNEVCTLTGNTSSLFDYAACYENYISSKIDNENKIASMLCDVISLRESSNAELNRLSVIAESKFTDSVKSKWNRLLEFIKKVVGKFMESLNKILLDQKDYLDKYKDTILKKKPKDIEYSVEGDYETGIKRMINTKLPIFDYGTHAAILKEEGDGPIVKKIMAGTNFEYDDGADLADLFKNFFSGADAGTINGTFDQLNMTNIYNFCYNVNKIEKIVRDDQSNLEKSTQRIQNAITTHLQKTAAENSNSNGEDKSPEGNKEEESKETTPPAGGSGTTEEKKTVEHNSAIVGYYGISSMLEADEQNKSGNNQGDTKAKQGTISINTDAISQMSSYNKDDKQGVSDDAINKNKTDATGATEKEINDMISKWLTVCRTFITAKLTICERISKSYMEIIRTHVRSYVGTDDKDDNRTGKQQGSDYTYRKQEEKQQEEAPQGGK